MRDWRPQQIGDLATWIRGSGDNYLVLLHGGPGLSDYMDGIGDLLIDRLGETWSVVRYQQRGLSPSTTDGPFTVEQHVSDLLSVCDGLGAETSSVLGHSWGGHLAMHALVADDERFDAAVIVDPLGAVIDGGFTAMGEHFAARYGPEDKAELERIAELVGTQGPSGELSIAEFAVKWPYYFSDPKVAPPMPAMRSGVDVSIGTAMSIAEHFMAGTLVSGLPRVSTRTLFLAGTKGPIPHVESERSAALMPNADIITFPTGHFPWMEDTSTLEPVVSFLRSTSRP